MGRPRALRRPDLRALTIFAIAGLAAIAVPAKDSLAQRVQAPAFPGAKVMPSGTEGAVAPAPHPPPEPPAQNPSERRGIGADGARDQRATAALPEKEKRKLLAPVIRAATECIAKTVQRNHTTGEPDPARVLSAISEGVAQCRDQIAKVTAEHDRLYGSGTGQAFVNGAYLKDLPRAVLARSGSVPKPPLRPVAPTAQVITPEVAFPFLVPSPPLNALTTTEAAAVSVGGALQQSRPEQTPKADTATSEAAIRLAYEALNRADYPRALELLRPLARNGHRIALHNMGVLFATGQGLPRDVYAAQALFRMAAHQNYAPSFRSLGLMFAYGEGVQVDFVEAYQWFELARRQVERDGSYSPEWGMLEDLKSAQEKLSAALTTKQLDEARIRADGWNSDTWRHDGNKQLPQKVKTLEDYNRVCQPYAGTAKDVRGVDDMMRAEAVEGRFDLLTCISIIEYSWTIKDCDGRKPIISEILYYLRFLALKPEVASQLPASASVATALVIGDYCKPQQAPATSTESVSAKLRQAYKTGSEPKLTEDDAQTKLENWSIDDIPLRN